MKEIWRLYGFRALYMKTASPRPWWVYIGKFRKLQIGHSIDFIYWMTTVKEVHSGIRILNSAVIKKWKNTLNYNIDLFHFNF